MKIIDEKCYARLYPDPGELSLDTVISSCLSTCHIEMKLITESTFNHRDLITKGPHRSHAP